MRINNPVRDCLLRVAALTAERDGLDSEIKRHEEEAVTLRREYDALKAERDALTEQVARIRQPRVYIGATFYTQADVPEICPDCDGRNFISIGVRGMVCWTCCLMRDLELVETENAKLKEQVARLSAPMSIREWQIFSRPFRGVYGALDRAGFNALIASRTSPAQKEPE